MKTTVRCTNSACKNKYTILSESTGAIRTRILCWDCDPKIKEKEIPAINISG